MFINSVKKALASGEVAIGTMISEFRNPSIITMMEVAGFDYVMIDLEHSNLTMETVADMISVAKSSRLATIIRTAGHGRLAMSKPLDAGADGLLIPQTETSDQVESIVRYTKYHPMGQRGMAMRRGHSGFAKVDPGEYVKQANDETMIVIQIESRQAIENLEQLVGIKGVDAAFIGPADLSQSYGLPGQFGDVQIQRKVHEFIKVCNKYRVVPGIHLHDLAAAQYWLDAGMRLLTYSNDINMLVDTATRYATELKAYIRPNSCLE